MDVSIAYSVLGTPLSDMFADESGSADQWLVLEFPLWDLAGKRAGLPVHRVAAGTSSGDRSDTPEVAAYDTSLYFELSSGSDEPKKVAQNAAVGYESGHRPFKLKMGRGARWMDPDEGLERDVAVVDAVRREVGEHCTIVTDANNGYNFNLAKEFLRRTAGSRIHWLEEPFHEDALLFRDLREWIADQGYEVLLADCETVGPEEG